MNPIIKNWQFLLVGFFVILAIASLAIYGINFGIDFKGGTLYQVELQKSLNSEEMLRIITTIEQRIDPSGLRGDELSAVGSKYIMIKTAVTDSKELEKIEMRIRQQGKFESNLNGEIVFTGDEIKKVQRGDTSFGVFRASSTVFEWSLPFVLNEKAAKSFKEKTFHQCNATSFSTSGTPIYECAKTVFFLDKPSALIVNTEAQYDEDSALFITGNQYENIPQDTKIDDFIRDTILPVVIVGDNASLDMNIVNLALAKTKTAIVSADVSEKTLNDLNSLGFSVLLVNKEENIPWIWSATNAKQIISLTEGITNEDVADISMAKEFTNLRISGQRATVEDARADLEELAILLESGSLPTPVASISKETISPSLGKSFLSNIILMGILALIIVAAVIMIRYRDYRLAIPVFATVISETLILVGLLSLPFIKQPFDLAALAGLIAALGSGVNAEVVIVDELTGKNKRETLSLLQRIKSGLFIITTSAVTIIGVMGPIVFFSRSMPGLSSLYGFALVAILGAIIGVLITRPAFTKVVEMVVHKRETKEHQHHEQK